MEIDMYESFTKIGRLGCGWFVEVCYSIVNKLHIYQIYTRLLYAKFVIVLLAQTCAV